ncbi:hypothetical protein ATCC90586_005491 [Pythium insidiosum]|nr:hypothetical protein ATCC90586_005491 [Pythium insidiosum]
MSELYRNAVCLAPMVRAGTLPLRLLSLRYGADLVYGEEIIDKRIIATTRVENAVLNTIDYVSKNGDSVVFRTCAEERGKVVFQIGTADPQLALRAAQHVARDVAAIDVNMGCPKHFSIQGGMGAALLQKRDIIKTLSSNLNIPVSAKIRLFPTTEETIEFAKALQDAGAVAIGLHARRVDERPVDDAYWDLLTPVVKALSVPVLVNGDIFNREHLERIQQVSGASSFLIARGALSNASIFRREGMLDSRQVVLDYLKVAAETDNVFQNTKYNLSRMLPSKVDEAMAADPAGVPVTVAELGATKDNLQMFSLWNLQDLYQEHQARFQAKATELGQDSSTALPKGLEHKYDDAHVLNRQFFCDVCQLQMLSDKDVELHVKGKRHKKKVRANSAATLSEQVARSTATGNDENSEPAAKRLKCLAQPPELTPSSLPRPEREGIVVMPCCYDGLTAKLIERAGFELTFMSGFGVSAVHGFPDTQLLSFGEMERAAKDVCAALRHTPCIGDGDTGYGNALNVKRTVVAYMQAGMAGIMLEDQVAPKRCGHTKGKSVVSRDEAFARLRAAVDARRESNMDIVIMARTDARATHSLDEAIARCQEFVRLGADITFLEAPQSLDEMARYCREVPGPKMANMLENGLTPVLPPAQLAAMGFKIAAYPLTLLSASIKTMERALDLLKHQPHDTASSTETTSAERENAAPCAELNAMLCDFAHVKDVVGFTEYYQEEARYSHS